MTLPVWLIQADVFGRSADPFKSEIRRQGMAFEIVQARPFLNGVIPEVAGRRLAKEDCVVFWGTYPLMRHIQLNYSWVPGGWCTASNFDCMQYYPVYQHHMLNSAHVMLALEDALSRTETLFAQFAKKGKVFFRPTGLEKVFTGRCVDQDEYVLALESARYSHTHVLVSQPKSIGREWRLVIGQRRFVAASQYRIKGLLDVKPGCPDEVRSYVENVLSSTAWEPDPIFMLDVCECDGGLYVLELNSFSCSGMYQCDAGAVVNEVKRLATDEWERQCLS